MKFEHRVAVNEPGMPISLSWEELWFGLLCRAENPKPFLPGLDKCSIESRSENTLLRTLCFGQVLIRDCVTLVPMQSIRFESGQTETHAGGVLTISIENAEPEGLALRFSYQTSLGEGAEAQDEAYIGFVKSAYHQSDIDTVRVIRTITESRRLQ